MRMMGGAAGLCGWLTAAAVVSVAIAGSGDDEFTKDKQQCAPQLVGLAPCLPYVGGNSKAPTMDCCSTLKQVLTGSKKCVCLLVKYRDDPNLGVKIDANLALGLPALCNAAPITNCPALLHLPPNSPDAKLFNDFFNAHNVTANSTTSDPVIVSPASTSSDSKASNGGPSETRFRVLAVFYGIFLVFLFSSF